MLMLEGRGIVSTKIDLSVLGKLCQCEFINKIVLEEQSDEIDGKITSIWELIHVF